MTRDEIIALLSWIDAVLDEPNDPDTLDYIILNADRIETLSNKLRSLFAIKS